MMERTKPVLFLVLPCYNEEETLDYSVNQVLDKLGRLVYEGKIDEGSKALFVDDGSHDNTLKMLHRFSDQDSRIAVVALSSNRGHQNAIMAGMMVAKDYCDICVTIDADLQHDIEALDEFISKYVNGAEVVYGIRNDRGSDGFAKKATAMGYYGLMHKLGANIMTNHADYRLLSRKALEMLSEHEETGLFLRGLIPTMGFKSDVVYFDVKERKFGKSKYTVKKMFTLAFDGITSMSLKPLRNIYKWGWIIFILAIMMGIALLIYGIVNDGVPGYLISICVTLLMSGEIMKSLGTVGEYVGRTNMEVKHRPRYVIDSIVIKE